MAVQLLCLTDSPIFTVPLTEVGGVEGQAVTLSVSIKANPEVTTLRWYRFDAASSVWSQIDVVSTSKYSGGTTRSPSLIISTLDSDDWGDYQAEASNVINTRRSLTIRVAVSCTSLFMSRFAVCSARHAGRRFLVYFITSPISSSLYVIVACVTVQQVT